MSGFNPDDYLAAPAAPVDPDTVRSISPDAEERAIRAMLAPQVGAGETALMSAVSSIPLGTLLKNLGTTAVLRLLNPGEGERATIPRQARMEWEAVPDDVKVKLQEDFPDLQERRGVLDTYRAVRDTDKERLAAGSEQNPMSARAGTVGGIGLSIAAPLPGVTVGTRTAATVANVARGAASGASAGRGLSGAARLAALARTSAGSRIASSVATGGAYGALSGATDGDADLTRGDIQGVLADTARRAVSGAAWGAAGGTLAEGARAGIPWLRRLAVRNAKEAIQGQSDIGAATRKPMRDESAAQMLDDGMVRALDNPSDIAKRVVPAADAEGAKLGAIIRDLEARGFEGPRARVVADALMRKYQELHPNISSDKTPAEIYMSEAKNILAAERASGGTLGVKQAENIKSSIQGRAPFAKIESTERGDALKDASRVVRQSTEDALLEQAAARDARANEGAQAMGVPLSEVGGGRFYGDKVGGFLDQKARVGKYLDAAQFSKKGASKFDQRPRVGLLDRIESQQADSVLGSKALARVLAEVRARGASTTAVGAEGLRKSLASGRAAERLAVGGASFGPFAADEAERWADTQDLDDPNLNPKVRALLELLRRRNPPQER